MTSVNLCIVGPGGRMGQRLVRLAHEMPGASLASGLCRSGSELEGRDVGDVAGIGSVGTAVTSRVEAALGVADVVIDFSAPAACDTLGPACTAQGCGYVVGSTGLEAHHESALEKAAEQVAVLQAANFSVGVNVLLELAQLAAQRLGASVDIEISEIHHRHKRDAPSGTALALGAAVDQGRAGLKPALGRSGQGVRGEQELGYAALRGGDVTGEHTVFYFGSGERIELSHRATTADIFARGAIAAAQWLRAQAAGRYHMRDVLAGSLG